MIDNCCEFVVYSSCKSCIECTNISALRHRCIHLQTTQGDLGQPREVGKLSQVDHLSLSSAAVGVKFIESKHIIYLQKL